MEFTNTSLEKVNEAIKVVNEFNAEVLIRAEKWLDDNYRDNFQLPAPHIVFHQEGWTVRVADTDKVLNETTASPIKIAFSHPDMQAQEHFFEVPTGAIFTESSVV